MSDLSDVLLSGFQRAFPACAEVFGEFVSREDPLAVKEAGKKCLGM